LGKVIHTQSATVRTGGSVADAGLVFQSLGNQVHLVGKIGNDAFGGIVRRTLEDYHAADDLIVARDSPTSYSVILSPPNQPPYILHCPGANDTFLSSDIPDHLLIDADLFHLGYPPVMRNLYHHDGMELVALFRRAKAFGCVTSLDFSSLDADSEGGLADWSSILPQVLPYVDFLLSHYGDLDWVNHQEPHNQPLASGTPAQVVEKLHPLAERALSCGCGAVLLKWGVSDFYLRTADEHRTAQFCTGHQMNPALWANCELVQSSLWTDNVVSTVGSGDAAIAAFLTAALDGERPNACLSLAAAEGTCCASTADALSGVRSLSQLKRMILSQ
jgi:sugar/nucleoside kinase (ribokinase family)